jgi:ParB-like chromosome segregation protein Spo0J
VFAVAALWKRPSMRPDSTAGMGAPIRFLALNTTPADQHRGRWPIPTSEPVGENELSGEKVKPRMRSKQIVVPKHGGGRMTAAPDDVPPWSPRPAVAAESPVTARAEDVAPPEKSTVESSIASQNAVVAADDPAMNGEKAVSDSVASNAVEIGASTAVLAQVGAAIPDSRPATGEIRRVLIADVQGPEGRPPVDQKKVNEIRESLRSFEQKRPILVRAKGNVLELLEDGHVLEAAKRLGWEHIDALVIEGTDAEVEFRRLVENLRRSDLKVLDHDEQTVELLELMWQRNPSLGQLVPKPRGGRPQGEVTKFAIALSVIGGTLEARKKIVRRAIKIASILPKAKAAAREAELDDNQDALLAIARETTLEDQLKIVRERADGTPRQEQSVEAQVEKFLAKYKRTNPAVQNRVYDALTSLRAGKEEPTLHE